MDELVVVEVVATEPEAELLCSLLRNSGIQCTHRLSNYGAGASDGMPVGGPQEVIVRSEDLASARRSLGSGDAKSQRVFAKLMSTLQRRRS